MKIYLHQFELDETATVNLQRLRNVFEENPGVDLVVAPEVFTSGFSYDRLNEIFNENRRALEHICSLCESYSTAFTGSFFWREKKGFYNRAYFISSEGEIIASYDKNNLIPAFREDHYLLPGKKKASFMYNEMRIGLAICYDLRFPELIRQYGKQETDLVIVPAQWPAERVHHMTALARARAIENQCYLVVVNAVRGPGKVNMAGHSMVIDPRGEIILDLGGSGIGAEAEVHLAEVIKYRTEFPALYQFSRPRLFSGKLIKTLKKIRASQERHAESEEGSDNHEESRSD